MASAEAHSKVDRQRKAAFPPSSVHDQPDDAQARRKRAFEATRRFRDENRELYRRLKQS